MCESRIKYSIDSSISQAKSRNRIFLWWKDSAFILFTSIVTWNLCLKWFDMNSKNGTRIWLEKYYFCLKLTRQDIIYSSNFSNFNYMEFVGYDTCDKLVWTSVEGCRITNTISKQVITEININKTSPSSTLGFGCSPYNDTCYILSEYLVLCIFQSYSSK